MPITKLKPIEQLTYDFVEASIKNNETFLLFPVEHAEAIEFLLENVCDDTLTPEEMVECINAIQHYTKLFRDYFNM